MSTLSFGRNPSPSGTEAWITGVDLKLLNRGHLRYQSEWEERSAWRVEDEETEQGAQPRTVPQPLCIVRKIRAGDGQNCRQNERSLSSPTTPILETAGVPAILLICTL